MKCKICGEAASMAFISKVMNKYDVKYFKCRTCGFLFTEEPFWLNEAYKTPINIYDTGIMTRNIYFSKIVSAFIYFCLDKDAKFLDYAGGYGIFTRLMRDIGFDYYWYDDFTENLIARGFEMRTEHGMYELLTAFEVLEHFTNPKVEIEKMLSKSKNIIFSTIILPEAIPKTNWWYYGFEHGQHISFYSECTLKTIATYFEMNFYIFNNLFLMTKKKFNYLKLRLLFNNTARYGLYYLVKSRMKSLTEVDNRIIRQS